MQVLVGPVDASDKDTCESHVRCVLNQRVSDVHDYRSFLRHVNIKIFQFHLIRHEKQEPQSTSGPSHTSKSKLAELSTELGSIT